MVDPHLERQNSKIPPRFNYASSAARYRADGWGCRLLWVIGQGDAAWGWYSQAQTCVFREHRRRSENRHHHLAWAVQYVRNHAHIGVDALPKFSAVSGAQRKKPSRREAPFFFIALSYPPHRFDRIVQDLARRSMSDSIRLGRRWGGRIRFAASLRMWRQVGRTSC